MAWTSGKGFNFRSTAGFVTDGATEKGVASGSDVIGVPTYPTSLTLGSDTFNYGWASNYAADGSRDRNSGIDARLAGMIYEGAGAAYQFKIEVPTGTYTSYLIRLALGDNSSAGNNYVKLYDNTTLRTTIAAVATTAAQWADATGVVRTSASDWVTNNASITITVATGPLVIEIGNGASGNALLSHVFVQAIAAASSQSNLLLLGAG